MPADDAESFMRTVGEGLYNQALAQAATGSYSIHIPTQDLPPGLIAGDRELFQRWRHTWEPPPPPPPPPDSLTFGPVQLTFPDVGLGGTPVSGWAQLSLHSDGNWNFSGHLRDSGSLGYNDAVVWGFKNLDTNEIFLFRHTGQLGGTFSFLSGTSRDDDWDNSGNNGALADGWAGLFKPGGGHAQYLEASVSTDLQSVTNDVKNVLGVAAAIIAVL
jgi:hypothetical protein